MVDFKELIKEWKWAILTFVLATLFIYILRLKFNYYR